ncbi:MAG: YlmC/YmxH family sporulation protein [Ruminococcaceae bacterium]|nr:YlmC/YmxH family sporulation protein [Oscillospiraceae bacterium]
MKKATDFKNKEVINIRDGRRLGYVCDVEIDIQEGMLKSIVVPGGGKWLPWGPQPKDIVISWSEIKTIGDDLILVDKELPQTE